MRNFKTEGIVIRRRNFKDADRILTVLTKDHGKIAVKASGIRRIPSRRSAHVELLNHCVLTLYNGHAFPILTEAQTIENFTPIKEDLHKIGLAYHLCELVDGLCPENQENHAVFELLKKTLGQLSFQNTDSSVIARSSAMQNDEAIPKEIAALPLVARNDNNIPSVLEITNTFQTELLHLLGYWNKQEFLTKDIDMDHFVENILERKLKSKSIFAKIS